MLENYYDIKKEDKFESLFNDKYIGKNPTVLKNSYHILKFNFSGIDTSDVESTIYGFKREVSSSINSFVQKYGMDKLAIPNQVMKKIYSDFFISVVNETIVFESNINYGLINEEIASEGKLDAVINVLKEYLNNLSNRDFQRFDEKHLKLIFYGILMNLQTTFWVKSEPEIHRKYPDILMIAKNPNYCSVMIEFKYLKRNEEHLKEQRQSEAKTQIMEYSSYDEIKKINNLTKYTVVAVVDEIFVEKIEN